MNNKIIKSLFCVFVFILPAFSCTEVAYRLGNLYASARNFDWHPISSFIVVNPKGHKKHALNIPSNLHALSWHAKYGSVSIDLAKSKNQISYKNVLDGMNSTGFAAAQLWLGDSKYPKMRVGIYTVANTQLVQYLLDTCNSVPKALAKLRKIQVYPLPYNSSPTLLQFALSDSYGNATVVSFQHGKMLVNTSSIKDCLSILTNQPYQVALEKLRIYGRFPNNTLKDNSDSFVRFIKAHKIISATTNIRPSSDINQLGFFVMGSTFESKASGTPTLWSVVRSLSRRQYCVRTVGTKFWQKCFNLRKLSFAKASKIAIPM